MALTGTVRLDLPADIQYLGVLEGCLNALLSQETGLADREARTFEVILAVHETCSNIVEHAYGDQPGRIEVSFTFRDDPRRLIVDLHDTGRPFQLPEIRQPNERAPQTRGYGLFLIHRLMDEVIHEPAPGNNHWRLTKLLK
jgi:serine/threonine-protein kinase RsbW